MLVRFKKLFFDNRLKVAFTLCLIWILSVWHFRQTNTFFYPLIAIFCVAVSDLGITFIRDHKYYLPFASLVTGFLIGMILGPSEPVRIIIIASLAASFSKQFIASGKRAHIFNPAGFGILFVSLIFGAPVGWWAVSWSKLPLIILVPFMAKILWDLKRITLPVSFLTAYFFYNFFIFKSADASFKILLDGTTLLFALVMLPEPITSPIYGYFKWSFGLLAAVLAIMLNRTTNLAEIFIPALLGANLIGFAALKLGRAYLKPKNSG